MTKVQNNTQRELKSSLFLLDLADLTAKNTNKSTKRLKNVCINDVDLSANTINIMVFCIDSNGKLVIILDEQALDLYEFEEYWLNFTYENHNHSLFVDLKFKKQVKQFFGFNILEVF